MNQINRRRFLEASAVAAAGAAMPPISFGANDAAPPFRAITRGPKFHWFGYYDKLEFDAADRYALGMAVDFEHRSPTPSDVVRLGMVDLRDGDRWIPLGQSSAWCWQQGCMLQWLPGSADEILWNDRDNNNDQSCYVCRVMNVKTRKMRTIEHPIYSVSPDGRWAIAPDFRRIADMRPGYGYVGMADPNADVLAPADSGVFRIDLQTGEQRLLISLADIAKMPYPGSDLSRAKHWFNHLLINTDGTRLTFLHRWKLPNKTSWLTRMITANPDGSDVRVLINSGFVSHFIWRDPRHILAYSKPTADAKAGFYLYEDKPGGPRGENGGKNGTVEPIGPGVMRPGDGHCTYLPGNRWILCDTYPDKQRNHHIYLYNVAENRRVDIGTFFEARRYWEGSPYSEWRSDTHPRFSRDGRTVIVDSPCDGHGRQMYLIDISKIVS